MGNNVRLGRLTVYTILIVSAASARFQRLRVVLIAQLQFLGNQIKKLAEASFSI